jgi:hypothetical protein
MSKTRSIQSGGENHGGAGKLDQYKGTRCCKIARAQDSVNGPPTLKVNNAGLLRVADEIVECIIIRSFSGNLARKKESTPTKGYGKEDRKWKRSTNGESRGMGKVKNWIKSGVAKD